MRPPGLPWLLALAGCSTIQTVRLQPETVDVGPGLRPIAGIHAAASSFYLLGIPLPGDIGLDRVVNRMLIVSAKTMGADKVANLSFSVDCASMCFARLFGILETRASGIAVQVTVPPPDTSADDGPEAPPR